MCIHPFSPSLINRRGVTILMCAGQHQREGRIAVAEKDLRVVELHNATVIEDEDAVAVQYGV